MTNKLRVIFFGSFLHYSAKILEALIKNENIDVVKVVTTPPLVDKKGEHKNPVHQLAELHQTPVYTPDVLTTTSLAELAPDVDYFITAGYGKLLPVEWLEAPKIAPLNIHLSLLPNYRGANPGEWALLMGEKTAGITVIEMSPSFDTGMIVAQCSLDVDAHDNRETLYEKLYSLGAETIGVILEEYHHFKMNNATELQKNLDNATKLQIHLPPLIQSPGNHVYARRLRRDDGFIEWKTVTELMNGILVPENEWPSLFQSILTQQTSNSHPNPYPLALLVERATRALAGFPNLWTEIPTTKGMQKMKILEVSILQNKLILEKVHIAGKAPAKWNEVKNILLMK